MNGTNSIYDQSVVSNSREFPHLSSLTSMPLHPNESTTRLSTNTLINDDHNASFEDEDDDDDEEHSHNVDQTDTSQPVQSNGTIIVKACALYDFNGKIERVTQGLSQPSFVRRSWNEWMSICQCCSDLRW